MVFPRVSMAIGTKRYWANKDKYFDDFRLSASLATAPGLSTARQLNCQGRWCPTRGNDRSPMVEPLDHLDCGLFTTKSAPTMQVHLLTPMPFWSSRLWHYVACDYQPTYDKLVRVSRRCRPVLHRRTCTHYITLKDLYTTIYNKNYCRPNLKYIYRHKMTVN